MTVHFECRETPTDSLAPIAHCKAGATEPAGIGRLRNQAAPQNIGYSRRVENAMF